MRKRIELPGIGPCVLVDTAGYGDGGELGSERERLTRQVIDSTDVAVLLLSGNPEDAKWQKELDERDVPVVNDNGLLGDDVEVDSELEVCRFSVFYIP